MNLIPNRGTVSTLLLDVKVISWANSKLHIKLTQSKFSNTTNTDLDLWNIPVSYITSENPNTAIKFIFDQKDKEITIENMPGMSFFNFYFCKMYKLYIR